MRHGIKFRRLSRDKDHRRALFRNQTTSLIEHERIETTVAKAKELQRVADHLVTLAKRDTPRSRAMVGSYTMTNAAARKMIMDLAPRFRDRRGGYTRVLKTRFRRGDCAPMAVIEWSDTPHSILTPEQLQWKQARKSKNRRGLAEALDLVGGGGAAPASGTAPDAALRTRTGSGSESSAR